MAVVIGLLVIIALAGFGFFAWYVVTSWVLRRWDR